MYSILIVDDIPENLRLLVQILESNGYVAHPALNAMVALEFLLADRPNPDLILLDVKMPGMNGYELCHYLKTNAKTRDIPVIFVSVGNQLNDRATAFAHGCVDYIVKPFIDEDVLMRVNAHLQIRDQHRNLEQKVIQYLTECEQINEKLRLESAQRKAVERSLENMVSDTQSIVGQPPCIKQEACRISRSDSKDVSARELQILKLINSGLGSRDVASVLFLAEVTVKWHLKNIYLKLDVKNRSQAIIEARRRRIVS